MQRWNAAVLAGEDTDFARFTPGKPDPAARALHKSPYYALQLFPMTRKSMGGLAIDANTRVLDERGRPIPGLYAAGEVTGVAGINGSYGGEGTFLGPSVYLGRLAGRAVSGGDAASHTPAGCSGAGEGPWCLPIRPTGRALPPGNRQTRWHS